MTLRGQQGWRVKNATVESLIKAQRIMCLKKYLDGNKSTWKLFLDHYLRNYGGSFLLKCNSDVSDLPRCLPKFYRESLCEWFHLMRIVGVSPLHLKCSTNSFGTTNLFAEMADLCTEIKLKIKVYLDSEIC